MVDRIGQQFGNYRLVRLLGRGGFAEVFLGQHMRLNMQAAIKILHTQLADENIVQFQREANTIAALTHPHIVRVLDFDLKDGVPFFVMDFAPNGSLRQLHPQGSRLPLSSIVSYIKQIAPALQYAHEQKLIHRDVKPENLLLGRNNEVLLSDFGIALMAQSSRHQSTRDMAGTISYMAPEQIEAHPRSASDQYSLGVIVYEWLCGERPFQGSFTEIAIKHSIVPPPPLREKRPDLPTEVEQVVMTALAKDPKQRFASIQAFATALELAADPKKTLELPQPGYSQPLPAVKPVASQSLPSAIETATPIPPSAPLQATTQSDDGLSATVSPLSTEPIQPPTVIKPLSSSLPTIQATPSAGLVFSPAENALQVGQLMPGSQSPRFSRIQGSRSKKSLFAVIIGIVVCTLLGAYLISAVLLNRTLASSPVGTTPTTSLSAATTPSPTLIPITALSPVATSTKNAQPTPTPTSIPATQPLPTPTPTMPPTPTPTPSPTPTPTPSPTPSPTATSGIHEVQCGNNLVAPWVALYQYSNFGGIQICFSGVGLINLANYGFADKTEAINIAANGTFYSSSNAQLGFYYGDEQSDLGSWDNQIVSFSVNS